MKIEDLLNHVIPWSLNHFYEPCEEFETFHIQKKDFSRETISVEILKFWQTMTFTWKVRSLNTPSQALSSAKNGWQCSTTWFLLLQDLACFDLTYVK
jgi:hypothetical protein